MTALLITIAVIAAVTLLFLLIISPSDRKHKDIGMLNGPRLLTLSPPGPSGLPGLRPGLSGNSVHLRSRWAKSKFPANGSLQRLLLFL